MMWRTWREAFHDLRRGPILDELGYAVHRSRLWSIGEGLDASRLRRMDDDVLLDPDLLMGDVSERAAPLFLNHYSAEGLRYALTRYGLWERLRGLAGGGLRVEIAGVGQSVQTLRILDEATEQALVELSAGLVSAGSAAAALPSTEHPWLSVEWLCLQDPRRSFAAERPALPGQKHPGLGEGREVIELLLIMGWRLGCAGLFGHPAWFHNAVMYRIHFRFVDPAEDGRMRALLRTWRASGLGLGEFSRAVSSDGVVDDEGSPIRWTPGFVVAPLMAEAEFQDDAWYAAAKEASEVRYALAAASSSTQRP